MIKYKQCINKKSCFQLNSFSKVNIATLDTGSISDLKSQRLRDKTDKKIRKQQQTLFTSKTQGLFFRLNLDFIIKSKKREK